MPGCVFFERGVRCGFSGTALIEKNGAVDGRVKVSTIYIVDITAWSSVKVYDRETCFETTFFPVQIVDFADFKKTTFIN